MPDGRQRFELRDVINIVDRLTASCFTASSAVHAWDFAMICQQWVAVIVSISCVFSVAVVSIVFRHGAVYFGGGTCISIGHLCTNMLESASENFDVNFIFHDERVPSRQTVYNLVNKLRSAGPLKTRSKNISAEWLLRKS
jgi:hypothetical protein